jgi:hypothetical protein
MAEARRVLAEARKADPAYRESGLMNLEVAIEWMRGNFAAAVEAAREAERGSPGTRVRLLQGMVYGALAAVEVGLPNEARRHLDRADAVLAGRDWQMIMPISGHAEACCCGQRVM